VLRKVSAVALDVADTPGRSTELGIGSGKDQIAGLKVLKVEDISGLNDLRGERPLGSERFRVELVGLDVLEVQNILHVR